MMNEDDFWRIIDASRDKAVRVEREDGEELADVHMDILRNMLTGLKPEEIEAFDAKFSHAVDRAYRWDLWAAAYWMQGGCSDDGFMDFRACLVALGKDWYSRIVANPDVLAETLDRDNIPDLRSEGYQYVAGEAYEKLTDVPMPDPDPPRVPPSEPEGEPFDEDDVEGMKKKLPKLSARLPDMGS